MAGVRSCAQAGLLRRPAAADLPPSWPGSSLGEHPIVRQVAAERMPDCLVYHLPRSLALGLRFIRVDVSLDAEVEVAARLFSPGGDQRADGCVSVLGVSDGGKGQLSGFLAA